MKVGQQNINNTIQQNNKMEIWENVNTNFIKKTEGNDFKESYQILHSNDNINLFQGIESKDDIQEFAQLDEIQSIKKQAETITNTASAKDCAKMSEEGKSLYDTEVEEIVTVIDKIKISMAQSENYKNYGDELDKELIESATGSSSIAKRLVSKLKENNIPDTQENITDSLDTIKRAGGLETLTNGNVQYMIRNQLEPTISNLYKAQYSGSVEYQNPDADKIDWGKIQDTIESVIKEAGYEISEENIEDAQWIIKSQLPLTKETFQQKKELENLQIPDSLENTMDAIVNAIQEGRRPEDANVVNSLGIVQQGQQVIEVIENITTNQIEQLLEQETPLTLEAFKQLQNQQENIAKGQSEEALKELIPTAQTVEPEESPALIAATRQLEEIRLMMTLESAVQMLKQGIQVETQELEQLVESLKTLEKQSYEKLFSTAQVEASDENINIFQESNQCLETIKGVPSHILGKDIPFTIKEVSQEGSKLRADLEKANEAYETLMTTPRKDMGDSIEEAFQNVEEILDDLGLEKTQSNVRAVKILGYNSIEISEESIFQIKEKDTKVQSLVQNLTPSVTLELIRKGINPLEMDIEELNQIVRRIKEEIGISEEEKFSSYLYKLEQNNQISEEERSSYIGVYRLLNQVEKTDGAAVGALVNQGAEITLKNLLTSVRTLKSQGIDVQIDREFGTLGQLNLQRTDIVSQIETAYYSQLVQGTLDVITPDKLQSVVKEQGSFEVIEEMPFEVLAEEIKEAQENEEIRLNYSKMQLEEFSKIQSMEDDVIKLLNDFELPVTVNNLLAAESALKGKGKAYRKLFSEAQKDTDLAEVMKETFERFAEDLKTPEDMAKAQNDLADTAENVMKGMLKEKEVSSLDVREMKLVYQEIKIGIHLAKEEQYTIPILVGDDVSVMNLKIVRGKEEKGAISISMDTEVTGKLTAKLQVSQDHISGYVVSKNEAALNALKEMQEELTTQIEGEPEVSLNYISNEFIKSDVFQKEIPKEEAEDTNTLQTTQLYQVAKAFVGNVQKLFSATS